MKLSPRFEKTNPKTLLGLSIQCSLDKDRTKELWTNFIKRKKEINSVSNSLLYSLQEYPLNYFTTFHPSKTFTKWALIEMENKENVPEGMSLFSLPAGDYAVFSYKGLSSDPAIFQYIFTKWIPNSPYELDHRPHFEILDEKYKNNDPNSEEEIWIPIKLKTKKSPVS